MIDTNQKTPEAQGANPSLTLRIADLPDVLTPEMVRDVLGFKNRRADQVLQQTLKPAGLRILTIGGRLRVLRRDLEEFLTHTRLAR